MTASRTGTPEQRAEVAETAAAVNAETILAQRDAYSAEIRDLNRKLSNASKRIAELLDAQQELINRAHNAADERDKAEKELRTLKGELETRVVTVRRRSRETASLLAPWTVGRVTLWTLYEDEGDLTEPLCTVCGDVDCEGCEPDPRVLACEAMAEEGD